MKYLTLPLLLTLLMSLSGCDISKFIPKSSHSIAKAPVLKVYSMSDGGHAFVAYAVEVGGNEVVVSDPLGRSSHQVGDTIEYMAHKIEMSDGTKTLSYILLK